MAGITNPWERVRNHWVSHIEAELPLLRAEARLLKHGEEWCSAVCPLCSDKDGSASISAKTGYLNCRQCGVKGSLFDWLSIKLGQPPLDVMLSLAERFGVAVERKGKSRKSSYCDLDAGLELAVIELWKSPDASALRQEVERRGFKPEHFEPYSIGFHRDHLIFPLFGPTGQPAPRYHAWMGPKGKPKWRWGGPPKIVVEHGLWPSLEPPKDAQVILLCAGEWDVLTARERWKLHEQGIYAYTWSGGETTPLRAGLMPPWLKGREIRVCYDFDVWQGPDLSKTIAPSEKQLNELKLRRKNLLEGVCWPLAQLGNKITILAVPNPSGEFSADLRDYYDWKLAHGEQPNFDDFLPTPFADLNQGPPAVECSFQEAFSAECQKPLKFEAAVAFIAEDLQMPTSTRIECDAGSYPFCQSCNLLRDFPERIIRWDQYKLGLARFLSSREREKVIHQLIGKPGPCHVVQLHSEGNEMASRWMASDPDSLNRHELLVLSPRVPDFGEAVVVEGEKFTRTDSVTPVFLASKLSMPERERTKILPYVEALHDLCPWASNDTEELWEHVYFKRHDDLAAWVTGIFGRQNYHLAVDLVAHSALWWLDVTGKRVRGWVDANITGTTRSGKSVTARQLLAHYGIQTGMLSIQGLWSYAGLIASNEVVDSPGSQYRVRPGIIPRFHGKMLVLDEMQHAATSDTKVKLMPMLQEIRDTGSVHITKIASRKIQCAVRLLCLANPASPRGFRHYRWPCEALLKLYGSPESIARMDFAVTHDDVDGIGFVSQPAMQAATPHRFTAELCQVLLRRAWDILPEEIAIEKDAYDLAIERVGQWMTVYDTDLPLFTGPEKVSSLIRIAIAIANLTFSHPPNDYGRCHVRRAHVEWACQWLEGLWDGSGYNLYSAAAKKTKIRQPWIAEWLLLSFVGADPTHATASFDYMHRTHTRQSLQSWTGKRPDDLDLFISGLLKAGVFETYDEGEGVLRYGTTAEGAKLLRSLMALADNRPGEYRMRFERYNTWWNQANHAEGPKNVEPLPDEPGS